MEKNIWFRILIVLLALLGGLFLAFQVWALLTHVSDIILVLFLAWLLAFLLKPLAVILARWGVPLSAAVALVYIGLLLSVVLAAILVVPLIAAQLAQIGQKLPTFAEQLPGWIAPLQEELNRRNLSVDLYSLVNLPDLPAQLKDLGTLLVQNAISLATGVASAFLNTILILVISFYIAVDGDRIAGTLLDMVPDTWQEEARFVMDSIDRRFGGFLRGQLIQAIIYGLGTAIIMAWADLSYVEIASLIAGLLIFIPFFGPILGFIPPAFVAVLSIPFPALLVVLGALLGLQIVVLNVIAPKVMADAVGMHPILVFLALLLGIKLAGPMGAIFGVPVLAVVNSVAMLFYNRSKSVQRRRALRLGLVTEENVVECEAGALQGNRPRQTRLESLSRRLSSRGVRLVSLAEQFVRRRNGGVE
ncbi:MAG: AI-2E family transporter [Chloroflexota bacterium]